METWMTCQRGRRHGNTDGRRKHGWETETWMGDGNMDKDMETWKGHRNMDDDMEIWMRT